MCNCTNDYYYRNIKYRSITMQSLDDLVPYLEKLKISAFRKAELIKNEVHNVTIGPNSLSPSKKPETKPSVIESPKTKPVEKTSLRVTTETEQILPIRQIVQEYEFERQQQVREAVENRSKKFEIFASEQSASRKQQWLKQQEKFIQKMQIQEQAILYALQESEKNKPKAQDNLMEHYRKLEDERKKAAALLEAKTKDRELINQVLNNQQQFQSLFQEIMLTIKNCQNKTLRASLLPFWKQCKELNDFMSSLSSRCKTSVTFEEVKTTNAILQRCSQLKNDVINYITKFEEKEKEEIKEKQKLIEEKKSQETKLQQVTAVSAENIPRNKLPENLPQTAADSSSLDKFITRSNFKWYSDIIGFCDSYSELLKDLNDDKLKQFKFDCKKAVNLTVNAISAVSSDHLKDKYIKLSNLLRGQKTVIGDFQIRASEHPKGVQFCTDILAKKFVLQGDMMVSSNPEAAFYFATIIVTLWNESPDFGKLLLAYFFKECPYLVPFYIPRAVDQTDQDYYRSQGYKYNGDQVEKQDKFLKRMTGIMRLYFAILMSSPKQGSNKNPHNIKIAWTWFVSVLKLEPRKDITATMIHVFLESLGFEMQNAYRIQFFKILRYFIEKYFPCLKKIDSGGPVTRLECLLQEFKENGNQFKIPNGILDKNFW